MILRRALFLFALGLLVFNVTRFVPTASASNTIIVNPADSIQEAINSANEGDTILIKNGTYTQSLIIVNKTVTVLGESSEGTIIDGERAENAGVIFNVIVSNVKIRNLTIQNTTAGAGYIGVHLARVENVEVSGCIVRNSGTGIRLYNSSRCWIEKNRILDNSGIGIELQVNGTDNLIRDNLVVDNSIGIHVEQHSGSNQVYRNNLVDNGLQISGLGLGNSKWDNGYPSGGNYWSDYVGTDQYSDPYQNVTGSDGIGDTPYPNPASALDNYPLAGLIRMFWAGNWGSNYYVWISSNSTDVAGFRFSNGTIPNLQANATGLGFLNYFCRVTVPKQLMWVDNSSEWQVLVNGMAVSPLVYDDSEYTYFYMNYTYAMFESNKSIQINGTHAIPETTWPLLIIVLAMLSCQAVLMKRAYPKMQLHRNLETAPSRSS